MTSIRFGALIFALLAAPVSAQTPPVSGMGGAVVPGVCLLSREAIFANAKVGMAASARLKQISNAAQAEVDTERKSIEAELLAFRTEAARLAPAQRDDREKALAAKLQPVQAMAQQRSQEIEATRAKAMDQIATQAQPVIAQVYKAKNCGLLLDRNGVLGGNFANDLTADVVLGLDAKITTISFEREQLPQSATAAAR